jgi:AcrR family transcriptional regulator
VRAAAQSSRGRLLVGRPLAGRHLPRAQVAEIQRSRLVAGAVIAIDERGYGRTTVGHITECARVSRRTFYDLFSGREECLDAVLDEFARLVGDELGEASLERLPWRERLRVGLWRVLSFLDREPALARVCVVQAGCADPRLLRRRGELLAVLAAVVDEGRRQGARGAQCSPLTAEGVVGAALAIVHARLLSGEGRPLTGLQGELMAIIVLPYLGPTAARRERLCAPPAPLPAKEPLMPAETQQGAQDPLEGVRMRLTYRTVRVLEAVGQLGGSNPSNRMVAERAGIQDPGQISKLLGRLQRLGLLANSGEGAYTKGEPNAWALTPKGERIAQSIRGHGHYQREAA